MKRRSFLQTMGAAGAIQVIGPGDLTAQQAATALETLFRKPPAEAGLSVVYHWSGGVVTKEGITADLEGMAASGISIVNWFYFDGSGVVEGIQATPLLTPAWWELVEHLIREAGRLGLTLAPHICSTWGPAGSPEITPELSQQILVWSETEVEGGRPFTSALARPARPAPAGRGGAAALAQAAVGAAAPGPGRGAAAQAAPAEQAAQAAAFLVGRGAPPLPRVWADYYRDLAVLAFPIPPGWGETSITRKAKVTSNLPVKDFAKLADPANNERVLETDQAGWIQFSFEQPFTLRSVTVNPGPAAGGGFGAAAGAQAADPYRVAHSLEVQAGDDGVNFRKIGQLEPMYNGWQTRGISALTHTVRETTARHFRLVHNPGQPLGYDEGMLRGTRRGGGNFRNRIEPLGLASVVLSSTPQVHHLPCKNNTVWGRGRLVLEDETSRSACVPAGSIVNLTQRLRPDGTIEDWTPGPGRWKVIRFGYTSALNTTGHGLHCDKYSADAVRVVYHSWFAEFRRRFPGADKIIKVLNIDSWENGSQNWSPVLVGEFRRRRGYEPIQYLPCMAGVVVEDPRTTEAFLLDMRRTMSECVTDNFYGTVRQLAKQDGVVVTSQSVNQAMNVDDIEYFQHTDWPGCEFWVRAANNWKPNDIADAVSGARIYGKKVVVAEAFTGGGWEDHPFALKAMGDYHYTEGVTRMMLHVWNHQYYPNRVPGQRGAGAPFHHLNTWWRAAQPWRDYMKRAQALLQAGEPVEDILYFAGENLPCRALLHPKTGWCWAADPAPPEGYKHATVNRDGLLRLAAVREGRILLGALSYRLLVLRTTEPYLTPAVALKLRELVEAGATVYGPRPLFSPSLERGPDGQRIVREVADQLWANIDGKSTTENKFGMGRVVWGRPLADVLRSLGAGPDLIVRNLRESATGKPVVVDMDAPNGTNPVLVGSQRKGWGIRFCHRRVTGYDIYFVSNQEYFPVSAELSFRVSGRVPELWDPDKATIVDAPEWRADAGRTIIPLDFDPSGSVFVVFRRPGAPASAPRKPARPASLQTISGDWEVVFPVRGKPLAVKMAAGSWTDHAQEEIRHFSGTAIYGKVFNLSAEAKSSGRRVLLDLGEVHDLARVRLNGKDLGTLWRAPYVADITEAAVAGANALEVEVTNTWVNRLIGDAGKPPDQRVTTVAAAGGRGGGFAAGSPLHPAGLIGPVRIMTRPA